MDIPIQPLSGHDLTGITMFLSLFGGAALFGIVFLIMETWKTLRKFKIEAVLKEEMIRQGRSAEEIERIIQATALTSKPAETASATKPTAAAHNADSSENVFVRKDTARKTGPVVS